jgi:hypothetical protein
MKDAMHRTWFRLLLLVAVSVALGASAAPQGQPYGPNGNAGYGGSTYGGPAAGAQVPPAAPPPPALVTVQVVQALIGIKSNNKPWDGTGTISPDVIRSVETKLVSSGNWAAIAGAVSVELATIANSGFDSPDPFGTLQVYTPSGSFEAKIPYIPDTLSPNWTDLTINHVPLNDPGVRLRVTLIDRDAINNDPIGSAEINSADIAAAYAEARVYPVPVYLQGNRQLLFVGISVLPER